MLNLMKRGLKQSALATVSAFILCTGTSGPVHMAVQPPKIQKTQPIGNWKKFHSIPGKCMVSLPSNPEHVKQIMPFPEEGYELRYDVYVSAFEKKAMYMMLVAQYPPGMDNNHTEQGLESFLNGLVSQNRSNKLIFADLTEVQGHKALDFFIESQGVYFQGRAVMANNTLYLLAMECEQKNYLKDHVVHFINSFELTN